MRDFAATQAELEDPDSYALPNLECDLVLKGGISSGVVYPLAVCELARHYRFRQLGGTSAGAIGAALAAAAERGRATGGFARLARLPADLAGVAGGQTRLRRLFQPQPGTRPLFEFLLRTLGLWRHEARNSPGRIVGRGLGVLGRGWLAYARRPLHLGLSALALLVIAGFVLPASAVPLGLRVTAGGAVLLLLETLLLIGFLGFDLLRAVPANLYGLCSGLETDSTGGRARSREPALTDWLADLLDEVAGQGNPALPLTFGDLWGRDETRREIDLQVMTTSLTHARPFTVPFEARDLYAHPEELRALFPERIVTWMIEHARASETAARFGLCALPNPRDLPVIVAVRLSLSFPVLLSAVKLYTVDRTVPTDQQRPEPCWFSDGGLSSNFPVHFFDAPLPHRPTFGINLRGFRHRETASPDQSRNVFIPANRRQGRFLTLGRIETLGNFLSQLFSTLQNWSDNTLVSVEGFRERIAHVGLEPGEGGANLNMTPDVIARLSQRGWYAAKALVDKYAAPGSTAFDDHRWTRFTLSLATLQVWLEAFDSGYNADLRRVILERRKLNDATDTALETAAQLRGLVNHWSEKKTRFEVWHLARYPSERAKHVEAKLQIRPRL